MSKLAFCKYEGLGNDFIVVETPAVELSPALVQKLCDRHFGIGADGVLVVSPGVTPGAAGRMVVLNADGSRPEMCGNGLRCVAVSLAARNRKGSCSLLVDTDAGALRCEVDGTQVTISIGVARDVGPVELDLGGQKVHLGRIVTGNPHAITWQDLGKEGFERLGPTIATHPVFPQGTNVEFARLCEDGSIDVRVWERGVGPTLACGTGACATAVHACVKGYRPFDTDITVHLPGGDLAIRVTPELSICMSGPARPVFSGQIEL